MEVSFSFLSSERACSRSVDVTRFAYSRPNWWPLDLLLVTLLTFICIFVSQANNMYVFIDFICVWRKINTFIYLSSRVLSVSKKVVFFFCFSLSRTKSRILNVRFKFMFEFVKQTQSLSVAHTLFTCFIMTFRFWTCIQSLSSNCTQLSSCIFTHGCVCVWPLQ